MQHVAQRGALRGGDEGRERHVEERALGQQDERGGGALGGRHEVRDGRDEPRIELARERLGEAAVGRDELAIALDRVGERGRRDGNAQRGHGLARAHDEEVARFGGGEVLDEDRALGELPALAGEALGVAGERLPVRGMFAREALREGCQLALGGGGELDEVVAGSGVGVFGVFAQAGGDGVGAGLGVGVTRELGRQLGVGRAAQRFEVEGARGHHRALQLEQLERVVVAPELEEQVRGLPEHVLRLGAAKRQGAVGERLGQASRSLERDARRVLTAPVGEGDLRFEVARAREQLEELGLLREQRRAGEQRLGDGRLARRHARRGRGQERPQLQHVAPEGGRERRRVAHELERAARRGVGRRAVDLLAGGGGARDEDQGLGQVDARAERFARRAERLEALHGALEGADRGRQVAAQEQLGAAADGVDARDRKLVVAALGRVIGGR